MNNRQKRYVVLNPKGKKYHEMSDETHTVCGLRVNKMKHLLIEPPADATLCRQCSGNWTRATPPQT